MDRFAGLEQARKAKQQQVDDFNRQANEVSKSIGKAKEAAEREARKEEGRKLRDLCTKAQAELDEILAEADAILKQIPNLSHPDAPIGTDDTANRELRRGKHEPRRFEFKPLDHVQIAERLGLIDFEAGAKVAGHGFYFLKNDAVLLELALQRYAVDLLAREGFTLTITPDLARNEILQGTGFSPRGPETQIYSIENSDLSLIATAEITLGGSLAEAVLDEEQLPIKICGREPLLSHRGGGHGRATRGLYRVHQFTKVEMFAFTTPEQSEATLAAFCDLECRLFDGLGIPYRVVDTATGDLGGPAYRKFDLEAWMPGRGEQGRVRRGDEHQQLHRLPGAAARDPLSKEGGEGDAVCAHAQRHGDRVQPRDHRGAGELSERRWERDGARGAQAVDGEGADWIEPTKNSPHSESLTSKPARVSLIRPPSSVIRPRSTKRRSGSPMRSSISWPAL